MLQFEDIPFETHPSDRRGYELFVSEVWHSQQVCNGCFAWVRTIGPTLERWMGASYMTLNEWYERTESGSQEHTPFDHNTRFGTCFCMECGSDCTGDHAHTSLEGLIPYTENIFRYTKLELDVEIDGPALGREVRNLKTLPSGRSTGYETEVMGIAFARALETPTRQDNLTQATAD